LLSVIVLSLIVKEIKSFYDYSFIATSTVHHHHDLDHCDFSLGIMMMTNSMMTISMIWILGESKAFTLQAQAGVTVASYSTGACQCTQAGSLSAAAAAIIIQVAILH
jgi:hypothetical protein